MFLFYTAFSELDWDKYKQGLVKDLMINSKKPRVHKQPPPMVEVPVSVRASQLRPITNRGYHNMRIKKTDTEELERFSKRFQIRPATNKVLSVLWRHMFKQRKLKLFKIQLQISFKLK